MTLRKKRILIISFILIGISIAATLILTAFEENLMYLRDVQDHSQQALEFVKADQEILSGMIDLYLSLMCQKTNDKMKVLAVISTIFMPLTLIAGIYGMNFQHMPELGWEYSYPMVLLAMLIIGIGICWFLKQKDWF